LRNAKAQQLIAEGDYLKLQGEAQKIEAEAKKTIAEAEAKIREAEADLRKAQAEQTRYSIEAQRAKNAHQAALDALELEKKQAVSALELAALEAKIAAEIAKYEEEKAGYEATIANHQVLKAISIAALDSIADYFALKKAQLSLALLTVQQQVTLAEWKLQFVLIDAARRRDSIDGAYVAQLVTDYTDLLDEIRTLDGEILQKEFEIKINEATLALSEYDKTLAFAKYVEKLTTDINDSIAEIEAKKESLEFWKTYDFDPDALTAAKQLLLAAIYDTLYDQYIAANKLVGPAFDAKKKADTTLKYFKLDSLDTYYWKIGTIVTAGTGYTSVQPTNPDIGIDPNTTFDLDQSWDYPKKLAQAKVIRAIIASDVEYLGDRAADVAKLAQDTLAYYSTLGAKYVTAKSNLESAAANWIAAERAFVADPLSIIADRNLNVADSIYWDRYAAFHGGTPAANKVSENRDPDGTTPAISTTYTPSVKNYGIGADKEYANLHNYIENVPLEAESAVQLAKAKLAGIDRLIYLLTSDQQLIAYTNDANAKKNDYNTKNAAAANILGKIEAKQKSVEALDKIALGLGKTWNTDEGVYYANYTDIGSVSEGSILKSNVKKVIAGLEDDIERLERSIVELQRKIDKINETLELVGGYYYYIDDNDPDNLQLVASTFADLNITIAKAKAELADKKAEKSLKEAQAAAYKAKIDEYFGE
jgi:hypothetical protein